MVLLTSDLTRRRRQAEVMDDPRLDALRHVAALDSLARLNALSRSVRLIWSPIAELARQRRLNHLRVLDIATGSGDIPLALWRRARRSAITLDLHGVDVSERALEHARARAAAAQASIQFDRLDVLDDELPQDFDVVVCSLFLHHLADEQGARLLACMGQAARRMVVISDLERSRRGLWLTQLAVQLLTRSDVVRIDGPRSVRAAFSLEEFRRLARTAGLQDADLRRRWPSRLVLTWHKRAGT